MYVQLISARLNPEYRDEFWAAVREEAHHCLRDEPGCLRFDIFQDEHDPDHVFLYEVFRDREAHQEHRRAPHNVAKVWGEDAVRRWFAEPAEVHRGDSAFPPDEAWSKPAL